MITECLLDVFVGLIHVHRSRFHLGHVDGRIVHRVCATAVAIHEGETGAQIFELFSDIKVYGSSIEKSVDNSSALVIGASSRVSDRYDNRSWHPIKRMPPRKR